MATLHDRCLREPPLPTVRTRNMSARSRHGNSSQSSAQASNRSLPELATDVAAVIAAHGFIQLPITMRHTHVAANLPFHHRDPMDRFLIGQALVEAMTIVTVDGAFARYAAKLLW